VLLLSSLHWLTYLFGAILIYTAWKVSFSPGVEQEAFDQTPFAKWLQKHFRFHFDKALQDRFFYQFPEGNPYKLVRYGTKLLFVLLIIEATDMIFATDSIPAALACSNNLFVIYSSNIFAVLGLRSLFFALSAIMGKFEYLKYGVSAVLALIGVRLLLASVFTMPTAFWLMLVALLLGASIAASVLKAPESTPLKIVNKD
jgi:tellurite resistance protein TerC